MKIKESKLFPHPVLREDNNDYESSKFETKLLSNNLTNTYLFDLSITLDNKNLIDLINADNAKIICHIECSKTKYREIKELRIGKNEFSVSAGLVEGVVFLLPLIISTENLNNYHSKDFNKDYQSNIFNIEKGGILAVGKLFPIMIESVRDKLATLPSIFSIQESADLLQKGVKVGLSKDKIEVSLPKSSFNIYEKYRKREFYSDLMNSIIILPSLMQILEELKASDEDLILGFEDKRWFRVIVKKLKEEEIDFQRGELKTQSLFNLSQKILNYLNSKSIDSIINLEKIGEDT